MYAGCLKSQLPVGRDTITVIEGGNVLKSAWAGGLNYCMVSQMDVDLDGKQDLVLFDKVNLFSYGIFRCFINTGGSGQVNYVYSSTYSDKFPKVIYWAIFFDYNNDGKSDLFTYALGGIKVFKNNSTTANVSFSLKKALLMSNFTPTTTASYGPIYAGQVSVPGISDIDNDGDLDILTFSSTGNTIEYHKNMSQEFYSNSDSLEFQLQEYTWGDINESNCNVILNQFFGQPSYLENPEKALAHSGSCLMCFDRDGDGDKDLILGDVSCNTIHYAENGGSIANAHISDTTKLYPNYPNKASTTIVNMSKFPCTYYVDVNNDGKKDLVASPNSDNSENYQSIWYYNNASTTNTVNFQMVKKNLLQDEMIEVGEGAYPVLLDVDNDGLLDLIIGNHGYYMGNSTKSQLAYYRNTGTLSQPSYSLITRDFANVSSYVSTYTLSGLAPAAGDIDGDGDMDLILADYFGKMHWLQNTAGPGNPCNFSVFNNNPFGIITTSGAPYPQVIDVDRDGVLDLLVGLRNGRLAYYRNTGTTVAPSFTLVSNTFGNVNVKGDVSLYGTDGSCAPFMFDVGGSYKLLCGSISGAIYYYDNIDGNLSGNFNRLDTNVNKINDGPRSALQYLDINADGKRDLIVGNYAGGLSFYSSKAPIGINELQNDINNSFVIYPNPANDMVTIKSENNFIEKISVALTDVVGRTIITKEENTNSISIHLDKLPQGIYFFRITSKFNNQTQTVVKKIVKE